jgi:predicted hydrocarbon binding protein
VSGGNEFKVNETRCVAMGDEVCDFVIQKAPLY